MRLIQILVYDAFRIPAAIENTDNGYDAVFRVDGVINYEIIYRYFMHSHTLPGLPIHDAVARWHKVERTDFFPDSGRLRRCAGFRLVSAIKSGIRVQIQHLKVYASTESLKNPCIDPRFKYVTRGCAEYVEWMG